MTSAVAITVEIGAILPEECGHALAIRNSAVAIKR